MPRNEGPGQFVGSRFFVPFAAPDLTKNLSPYINSFNIFTIDATSEPVALE